MAYVFSSTFPYEISHSEDILGVLSLIIYTLLLIPMFKYVFIVSWANDNGDGTEAMFADLGHFNVRAVRVSNSALSSIYFIDVQYKISCSGIVFPTLLAAYSGQSAYLVKFPGDVGNTFYTSIPGKFRTKIIRCDYSKLSSHLTNYHHRYPLYWPTFIIAVAAAIIASQAMISEAFAIISQSLSLGCFPRVKVVRTSAKAFLQYSASFITNMPSIHSVLVFVSIKSIPISKVDMEVRFLFWLVEPRDYRMFAVLVRYAYNDVIDVTEVFERHLLDHLKEYIRHEYFIRERQQPNEEVVEPVSIQHSTVIVNKDAKVEGESLQQHNHPTSHLSSPRSRSIQSFNVANSPNRIISGHIQGAEEEMQFAQKAMENGVVYLLGEAEVRAEQNSSLFKRIVVNHAYNFLRKNFSQGEKVLGIPPSKLLRVGMTYEI
ncbi:hypothetical protein HYC85_018736 [Camellia sinensis]|uniref:K+ potassium transporter integral membrane domain-containing protein n=1 Tax=Camellia sinensis TaxID=4442 RepID=A0A7J7GV62_CAMSI|nr:hypothetical protein HYC85_018736 [Camellia sinensis]